MDEPDERGFFDGWPGLAIDGQTIPHPTDIQPSETSGKARGRARGSADKPHYAGHRERLRQRFSESGGVGFRDDELLELFLFRVIPRADTKPVAKALLQRFGTLSAVMSAPPHLLREVAHVGEAVAIDLSVTAEMLKRTLRSEVMQRNVLSSWRALTDYCRAAMQHETREQFRILFLDKKNALIADEVQQTGTVDHAPVYPREIVRRVLELSATAIILVHNHPSGDPSPSRADIEMTRKVIDVTQPLGIAVHDHVIVGRSGIVSLKAMGHI